MAATPAHPRGNLLDVDSDQVRRIIQKPPGSRLAGWNMGADYSAVERFSEGIYRGRKDARYLALLENGHMEFWTPLDEQFCYGQSVEEFRSRPRLYPYPVTEYPATFLKLYRAIVDVAEIGNEFLIGLRYWNLKGYILLPYAPRSHRFRFPLSSPMPFAHQHLLVPRRKVASDFQPDEIAYDLVKRVYASFGLEAATIPFYNTEARRFDFPMR
jgi:hypothetical protein